uniref:Uncharacterized protein n=1 Tax=Meloidogyne enterolobii TaxID=390850 RepID=A0A6V7W0E8_MELEN|nr:unnamed protein product [Meloidogyne enterolobii]
MVEGIEHNESFARSQSKGLKNQTSIQIYKLYRKDKLIKVLLINLKRCKRR